METRLLKAAGFLCLALIFLVTGCQPAKTADAVNNFTFEAFANTNSVDSVLGKYKSVRVESTYYEPPSNDGEWTSYQHTRILVKGDNGIDIYSIWDYGYESAVFKDSAYYKYPDGGYGVIGFIGDEYYEQYYVPETAGLIYVPLKDEKLVSNTVENGVRKLVVQADMDGSYATSVGITQGVIETVYELDLESGLILRASECVLDGDKRQVLAEGRILYGEDDSFAEPEYVLLCRDMSETRTVHFVQDAGTPNEKTYTFTLPQKAGIAFETESGYELFTDPACTVPYGGPPAGEYPDETTLYAKKF